MNRRNIIIGVSAIGILIIWLILPKQESINITSQESSSMIQAKELYKEALSFKNNQKFVEAKDHYQQILMEYPDIENVERIQKELEELNLNIIRSSIPTKNSVLHEVKTGDSLGKLARKYNTTIDLIKKSNKLKSDIIRIGQRLRVWTGNFNVLVDKSQNILILKNDEEVVKVYTVSTGENSSTPIGKYKITAKLVDPVWFNRGAVVPPDSPQNVLGSRWLGFDLPGYGIHGTIDPDRIGEQITAGCVRMRNEEVEELYSLLPKGTEVTIVD